MEKNITLFYCVGLHSAGGLTVLEKIISYTKIINIKFYFDERLSKIPHINTKTNFTLKKHNFFIRIWDEFLIYKDKRINKIFYLNGLPPLFKNKKTHVTVLFQNTNIFKTQYRNLFQWFFSTDFLRYIKFNFFKNNVDEWVVLSKNAKRQIEKSLPKSSKIILLSLNEEELNQNSKSNIIYDFIYPATLGYHKNHKRLIESFVLLANENIFPSLLLTLTKKELSKTNFNQIVEKNSLKIKFKSFDFKDMNTAYNQSRALIFPSVNETLGLPLIEAKKFNLDIIASELDFVRDISEPCETFDPNSSLSMSRAIKRYLLINNIEKHLFLDYNSYLNYLSTHK